MRGFFTQVVYNNNYNIIAIYLFFVENILLDPRYSILEMHITIILIILGEGSHFIPFCYFKLTTTSFLLLPYMILFIQLIFNVNISSSCLHLNIHSSQKGSVGSWGTIFLHSPQPPIVRKCVLSAVCPPSFYHAQVTSLPRHSL